MAYEIPGFKPGSLKAGADLSAGQFRAVKLDGSGDLVLAGAGELATAILQNKPALGVACEIDCDGVSKAIAGAAVAIGAELAADANGKLVTALTGNRVVAVAWEAASALDEVIAVKLQIGSIKA